MKKSGISFKLQSSSGDTIPLLIEERDQSDEYGAIIWPSAMVTSCFIVEYENTAANVLELGCGVGLCGITYALKHPSSNVILTDGSHEDMWLGAVQQNIKNNNCDNASSQILNWGCGADLRQLILTSGPFDLIIASDCLFDEESFDSFLYTLSLALSKGTPDCRALVAYNRRDDEHQLDFYFKKWSLSATRLPLPNCNNIIHEGKRLPEDWDSTVILWKVIRKAD
eukprot:TRINITY_DN19635_c0_g1_i1.p1 TRINITY_DN19635_c0_g1~~TRINITY_DN19635_c0_g1_i1.p1  ORF type:complete len:225 (+),score=32.14 TRINITY_DN19635_c0_g1_i1:107-781(+)